MLISVTKSHLYKINNRDAFVSNILLFCYIYNIAFAYLPLIFRTRIALGFYGIIREIKRIRFQSRIIFNVISLNLLYVIPVLSTFLLTDNWGGWFIQHGLLNIIYLFGGVFVAHRCGKLNISINRFLTSILYVIVFHNILALVGFLIPFFGDFLINIQNIDTEGGAFKSIAVFRSRFTGLGVGSFFTGGILSGLGIIISLFLINEKQLPLNKGVIILIFLLGTGMFIARTTLIGLIGLLLFINRTSYKRLLKLVFLSSLASIMLATIIGSFLKDYLPIDWAFEIFINLITSDKIETSSTNELISMWRLPTGIKTWIFGDGLFFGSDGAYYMHTDVGYLRIIYCIGIIGLGIFMINQLYLFWVVSRLYNGLKPLVFVLAMFLMVLNIKGFAEINFFFYLLIGFYSKSIIAHNATSNKYCTSNL